MVMDELTRRGFLQTAGAAAAGPAQAARRPNVLWIMADQFRWDCLGANHNRLIRTPHLDRLAARSANFTNAFVQAPVCVPSRISYFTGRYPHSHRNRVNYTPCDTREVFLHRMLKDAGYQTGAVGKLHFHPPTADHAHATGFDRVWLDDGVGARDPYSDYVKWRNAHDPQARFPYHATVKNPPPGRNPFRAVIDYEYTQTHWVGLKTRELLREFAPSEKPFFLFSSFFKPHAPFTVPAPFDAMYDDVEIPLPRLVGPDYIGKLPLPLQRLILRGTPVYDTPRERLQWIYRSYYGSVSMVDREVGSILDELDRSGAAANTIVIFCTDHGDQLLEHGLQGKNVFFESSVRTPFLVSFPGRARSGRYEELVESVDVAPTVLEWCGLPVPDRVQGRSLAPLLGGGGYRPRDRVFAENIIPEVITSGQLQFEFVPGRGIGDIRHPDAKMVRTSRWKLNFYPGHGGELYDLANDPGEWENLYSDPAHRATASELKESLLEWMIAADENDQIARRWLV
jgi:arylsulfatase A-like enzyme